MLPVSKAPSESHPTPYQLHILLGSIILLFLRTDDLHPDLHETQPACCSAMDEVALQDKACAYIYPERYR